MYPFARFFKPQTFHKMNDGFDLDSIRAEFEESYVEPEPENPEPEPEPNPENPDPEPEPENPDPENPEDDPEADELDRNQLPNFDQEKPKKQSKEENAAFAEMRRQNEELKRQAKVAEQVAAQYGMTVEEFEQAYEEQQLQQRAQQQGIPLDVLKRLEAAENQLKTQTESAEKEKFWNSVDRVKAQHGLQDNEVVSVFDYLGKNGLVNANTGLPIIDFEQAYKLANFDSLAERKAKEARQKDLEAKRQRQQRSALPTSTNASATPSVEDEITDEFVEKRLRERNLI